MVIHRQRALVRPRQHEWIVVLQGAARMSIEGELIELKPGDFVNIPAHQKHRVEWTHT